jgi:hypothetical protein
MVLGESLHRLRIRGPRRAELRREPQELFDRHVDGERRPDVATRARAVPICHSERHELAFRRASYRVLAGLPFAQVA